MLSDSPQLRFFPATRLNCISSSASASSSSSSYLRAVGFKCWPKGKVFSFSLRLSLNFCGCHCQFLAFLRTISLFVLKSKMRSWGIAAESPSWELENWRTGVVTTMATTQDQVHDQVHTQVQVHDQVRVHFPSWVSTYYCRLYTLYFCLFLGPSVRLFCTPHAYSIIIRWRVLCGHPDSSFHCLTVHSQTGLPI